MTYAELLCKQPARLPHNVVPHPRYGDKPIRSRAVVPDYAWSHWRHHRGKCFLETAIPADLSRQREATIQTGFYVDTLETCVDCGRPFIFFAKEQKHWFEQLGFSLDAWCIRCTVCRKSDRMLRNHFRRFSELLVQEELSKKELAALASDAVFLWENGVLVNKEKLYRIRSLARAKIPRHLALKELDELIESIKDQPRRAAKQVRGRRIQ